ncbi:methyltransferase domain-containing protein [Rhizoctonia solani AG-1 IA]|uniref:Methyltransferase domain-containing protein n=1 Tax=Thanatephorus cucumeris (strain AG1-IA) TaxID=983506 RepID=L8WZD2_THACA|nr:methyltransferase domain-containing protein [Rhizoctonia solani AG-1 IA]
MNAPNRTAECDWKPALYNKGAAFVYSDEYTKPVLDLLSAKPGERIVDLGCGTGELTLRIERIVGPEGLVLGIDSNESMLEKAKANGLKNSILCDIQDLAIPNEFKHLTGTFDAVFTNAVLHWCKRDPRGVVRGAKALLKPGGRFIGDFGGYMAALVEHISLNPSINTLPGSMIDFLRSVFRVSYLKHVDDDEAEDIIQEMSRVCEFDHKDETGTWGFMAVRIRFWAIAPM